MKDRKEFFKKSLLEAIKEHAKKEGLEFSRVNADDVTVERPKNENMGIFAVNVWPIASKFGKEAVPTATNIAGIFNQMGDDTYVVNAMGPYINLQENEFIIKDYIDTVKKCLEQKGLFGRNNYKKNKKILIEHTSPNPNKAFHLGHLKNNVTGLSISFLLEATGAHVYRDAIDNNRGIAIARLMWGYVVFGHKNKERMKFDIEEWYKNKGDWKTPDSEDEDPGDFVGNYYTLAAEHLKSNESAEEEVRQLARDWEAEDKKVWDLWKLTQEWVWKGYKQSLERVGGWKFDKIWHEHEHYKKGKEYVMQGLKEGIFKKTADGAIVSDLKKVFGLTDTILIKRDGTSLYITQDIALTDLKKKEFSADEMYWVIGPEQSLAMKQMFAVCDQLGIAKYEDLHHIPYGFVLAKNKEGGAQKMSSRDGSQVLVNDLIDKAKSEIEKRVTTEFDKEDERSQVAEKLAVAAVKYSLLKVNKLQDMVFDFEETISFDGNSGPYIMYAYTRAQSVLKSAKKYEFTELAEYNVEELALMRWVDRFPEVVLESAKSYAPHYIAEYAYELAQRFNSFYNKHSILNAENEKTKSFRLALTDATAQVIKNSLALLGIEVVEKM